MGMKARPVRTPGAPRHRRVRYAVAGLGYIAQGAMLPAFGHAREKSELVALISDDADKLRVLGRKYRVNHQFTYQNFEAGLRDAEVDAVYIALPNHMHREYTVRAANAGVHVLCEKPMAVTEADCEEMIRACDQAGVKLMIAYRLHFDEANMRAVELVASGRLGEPRIFDSVFTMQVKEGDIRLNPREQGGGTLYDIGIYCINAARYLFRDEPIEVMARSADNGERRFREPGVEEMTSAVLRFPGGRLATFTTSFGAADVSRLQVVGTDGDLVMDPAYEYAKPLSHRVTVGGRSTTRRFPRRDQFAPELVHFSECVMSGEDPGPNGWEGLADVRVIRALYASADSGRAVELGPFGRSSRPDLSQEMQKPPVDKPKLVKAESPSE